MKLPLALIALLLGFSSFSQVNILVSDETGSLFTLGIDGFLQNSTPKKKLIISNLDTAKHILVFKLESDSVNTGFKRTLKLPAPGSYKYALTRNFEGTFQLRFRGKTATLPSEIQKISFDKETAWPFTLLALNEKEIPTISSNHIQTLTKADTVEDTLTASLETSAPAKEALSKKDTTIKMIDTILDSIKIPIASAQDTTAVISSVDSVETKQNDFDILMDNLTLEQYEFNRLNLAKNYLIENSISVAQIQSLFKKFNYDNSRLQFLPYAKERLKDPENLKNLLESFDYDLTRERFKKDYLP
jgi:hypothetical protein